MSAFHELATTRKGTAGEQIARRILERLGWIIYTPETKGPHPIDFLAWKGGKLRAFDVKTYPRRRWRDDTGIDAADLGKYRRFSATTATPVTILFVDAVEGMIYGASLATLAKNATIQDGKAYFPLSTMQVCHTLTPAELVAIGKPGERYADAPRYFTDATGHFG